MKALAEKPQQVTKEEILLKLQSDLGIIDIEQEKNTKRFLGELRETFEILGRAIEHKGQSLLCKASVKNIDRFLKS